MQKSCSTLQKITAAFRTNIVDSDRLDHDHSFVKGKRSTKTSEPLGHVCPDGLGSGRSSQGSPLCRWRFGCLLMTNTPLSWPAAHVFPDALVEACFCAVCYGYLCIDALELLFVLRTDLDKMLIMIRCAKTMIECDNTRHLDWGIRRAACTWGHRKNVPRLTGKTYKLGILGCRSLDRLSPNKRVD